MQITVLWVYIVLLLVGGLIGFFKGKSQASLIASVASAVILILCALNLIFKPYVADLVIIALVVVFTMRLARTKKFMPSGLMLVVSLVALILRNVKL